MSEFGGLRKHEKTQHTLVGLGSAVVRRPEFPERDNEVYCKGKKQPKGLRAVFLFSFFLFFALFFFSFLFYFFWGAGVAKRRGPGSGLWDLGGVVSEERPSTDWRDVFRGSWPSVGRSGQGPSR